MPPLESFPKSQRVTFKYYEGVLFFLEENYTEACILAIDDTHLANIIQAEKYLVEAWDLCQKDAKPNSEYGSFPTKTARTLTRTRRILTYLIPCRLLTSHVLPTKKLLEPYPQLQELFLPLAKCIRSGDLRNFDIALQHGEDQFVKRRIYLTLERGRDIALRNLLRKVYLAGGFDEPKEGEASQVRRTRIPVAEFQAAIGMHSGGDVIDTDEVECLLANMIYKVRLIIPQIICTSSFTTPRMLNLQFTLTCLVAVEATTSTKRLQRLRIAKANTCAPRHRPDKPPPFTTFMPSYESLANTICRHLGSNERLHCPRTWHCCTV